VTSTIGGKSMRLKDQVAVQEALDGKAVDRHVNVTGEEYHANAHAQ
jgi:hypothetical protein